MVAVDVEALMSWWEGPGLGEYVDAVLIDEDDTGPDLQLARLREAAIRSNAVVEERHAGEEDVPTWGDVQGLGAAGAVVRIESFHAPALRTWLLVVDEELAGVVGRLTVHDLGSRETPGQSTAEPVNVTAVLAMSGWHHLNKFGAERPRGVWRNDPAVIEPIVDLALAWLEDGEGPYELLMGPSSVARPEQVRGLMTAAMTDTAANGGMGFISGHVSRAAPDRVRRVSFPPPGHFMLTSHDVTPIQQRVDRLTELCVPWSTRCDWIGIVEFIGYSALQEGYKHSNRGRRLPDYYRKRRHLDQEFLPDAFAWQVVTGRHLQRTHDLDAWEVRPVAPDRYLVRAPDLAPWFGYRERLDKPAKLHSTYVDEQVLGRARQDFGDAIYDDRLVDGR